MVVCQQSIRFQAISGNDEPVQCHPYHPMNNHHIPDGSGLPGDPAERKSCGDGRGGFGKGPTEMGHHRQGGLDDVGAGEAEFFFQAEEKYPTKQELPRAIVDELEGPMPGKGARL